MDDRGGRTVYVSRQVPLNESDELVGAGDVAAQARQTFENVQRTLESVGLAFADVVKMNLDRTRMSILPALRSVRDEFVDPASLPASTAVTVSALFHPEVLIEVDVIACA